MFILLDAMREGLAQVPRRSPENVFESREFMKLLATIRARYAYRSSPYYGVREMVDELLSHDWIVFDQGPGRVRVALPPQAASK